MMWIRHRQRMRLACYVWGELSRQREGRRVSLWLRLRACVFAPSYQLFRASGLICFWGCLLAYLFVCLFVSRKQWSLLWGGIGDLNESSITKWQQTEFYFGIIFNILQLMDCQQVYTHMKSWQTHTHTRKVYVHANMSIFLSSCRCAVTIHRFRRSLRLRREDCKRYRLNTMWVTCREGARSLRQLYCIYKEEESRMDAA